MTTQVLMTPGPVPLPSEVLDVLAKPMEHHRTPEFMALFNRVLENLRKVFSTSEPAFIHTSTGSGGMESAIVNTLSPGDPVLCIVSGKFGERWAEMAAVFGARVTRLHVEWGRVVDVREIEKHLDAHPETVAVLTQACETSTGALQPIREIGQVVRKTKALLMVDAITALGALPMPMDEWGIDVMIGGSQKAFMLPTGLSFISFSKKAWALTETSKMPKFYFDIRREKEANARGESYFSTAVTHIRALDFVLELFLKVGMHKVHERIQALSKATIVAAREMGLKILSDVPSPSVTAIVMPDGIDSQKVRSHMEKISNVIVMGGQDHLKTKIVRIGHMGAISDDDLITMLRALAQGIRSEEMARVGPANTEPTAISSSIISNEALERALEEARRLLAETPAVL